MPPMYWICVFMSADVTLLLMLPVVYYLLVITNMELEVTSNEGCLCDCVEQKLGGATSTIMCDLLAFEADRRAVNITINRQVLVCKVLLTIMLTASADSLHFKHMGYTMSVLVQNCFKCCITSVFSSEGVDIFWFAVLGQSSPVMIEGSYIPTLVSCKFHKFIPELFGKVVFLSHLLSSMCILM